MTRLKEVVSDHLLGTLELIIISVNPIHTNHCNHIIHTSFPILVDKGKVVGNTMSSKGKKWSYKEQKCLLEIWAEENISQCLEKVHKKQNGFNQSIKH